MKPKLKVAVKAFVVASLLTSAFAFSPHYKGAGVAYACGTNLARTASLAGNYDSGTVELWFNSCNQQWKADVVNGDNCVAVCATNVWLYSNGQQIGFNQNGSGNPSTGWITYGTCYGGYNFYAKGETINGYFHSDTVNSTGNATC